jgi:hypothetical protein
MLATLRKNVDGKMFVTFPKMLMKKYLQQFKKLLRKKSKHWVLGT